MLRAAALCLAAAALAAPPARTGRATIRVPLMAGETPLSADDLKVAVNGSQARVAALRKPGEDLILMLVLDITGDLTLADLARQALAERIQALPPKTWISLLRAQDGLQVLLDPTEDRNRVIEAVRAYSVSGKAGLLDTLDAAARLADAVLTRANVRLAILYLTDSNIYNYREDFTNPVINYSDSRDMSRHFPEGLVKDKISKLEAGLSRTQAPVFILHLDYRSDRLNEAYQSGLMRLANATGGMASFCRSTTDVAPAAAKMLDSVASLHFVTVELPRDAGGNIQLQIEAAERQLSYRSRFILKGR